MAVRRRRQGVASGPANAWRWRDHARYLARIIGITADAAPSINELRAAAEATLTDPTVRRVGAEQVLDALLAADEGAPYHPYGRAQQRQAEVGRDTTDRRSRA